MVPIFCLAHGLNVTIVTSNTAGCKVKVEVLGCVNVDDNVTILFQSSLFKSLNVVIYQTSMYAYYMHAVP